MTPDYASAGLCALAILGELLLYGLLVRDASKSDKDKGGER